MDGLVIIYATGGIVVSDIDEANLYLGSLNKKIDPRSYLDRAQLVKWAESEEATIFQTQLLAYKNNLRLVPNQARTESAERRILALATDSQSQLFHIIFNVTKGVYLGDITKAIFNYLNDNDMSVVAMLNLDTGAYNILNLFNEQGQSTGIHGSTNLEKASNLLVYYYE